MELKDFISQTLTQIIEGVHSAQKPVNEFDGIINPTMNEFSNNPNLGHIGVRYYDNDQRIIFPVQFDVSLLAEQSKTKGGKAGLKISVLSAGGGKQSKSTESQVAQVKFVVPVLLPYDNQHFRVPVHDPSTIVESETDRATRNF
jgi:hypothetical protein